MPILIFIYIIIPALQILYFLSLQTGLDIFFTINYCSSIIVFHWIVGNIIMAAKIPTFQKIIPYDKRVRFHILSSFGIILGIIYHGTFKLLLGYPLTPTTWVLLIILCLLFLTSIIWIPLPFFRKIRTFILNKISNDKILEYDKSKLLHRLIILTLCSLIMFHIMDSGLFSYINFVSFISYLLLYFLGVGSFLLSLTNIFRTKVILLDMKDNNGVIILSLSPKTHIKYKSGQFIFLGLNKKSNKYQEHPFSFLSSPQDLDENGRQIIKLGIKAVGDFTNSLLELKTGDELYLKGPYGDFSPKKDKNLCFIASGIGTVPIISILKYLSFIKDERNIEVFLAVNREEELPDKDIVLDISKNMMNLNLHFMVYSKDQLKFSTNFFRESIPNFMDFNYYLCSSPNVLQIVLSSLRELGVRKSSINYEAFSFG